MATIPELLVLTNSKIRQNSTVDRITASEEREVFNPLITELGKRGILTAGVVTDFEDYDDTASSFGFLYGSGIYYYFPNSASPPPPNGTTVFAGLNGVWIRIAGLVDGANSLDQLNDVLGTGWAPEDGDVLYYDGSISKWRPAPTPPGEAYFAPIWTDVNFTPGDFTITHASLVGAKQMSFIIVNKNIEYLDDDYTFDTATGVITRVNPNLAGDKIVTPHKK